MNKILPIFILIVISCQHAPKQRITERWANGKNKVVLTYDNPNDTANCIREFYFENGRLSTRGEIHNGKENGLWEWWYNNGNKKDEAFIEDGEYVGQRKHWREDGTLRQIEIITGKCFGDCCDGKVIFFDDTGIKLIEYSQKNGKWNGEGLGFFKNGKIKRRFTYVNGKKQGVNYECYPNGVISAEGVYIDDIEEGKWTLRDSTGQISGFQEYKNGKIVAGN